MARNHDSNLVAVAKIYDPPLHKSFTREQKREVINTNIRDGRIVGNISTPGFQIDPKNGKIVLCMNLVSVIQAQIHEVS